LPSPPGEGEPCTLRGNFSPPWCAFASWGLTSAATVPLSLESTRGEVRRYREVSTWRQGCIPKLLVTGSGFYWRLQSRRINDKMTRAASMERLLPLHATRLRRRRNRSGRLGEGVCEGRPSKRQAHPQSRRRSAPVAPVRARVPVTGIGGRSEAVRQLGFKIFRSRRGQSSVRVPSRDTGCP